MGLKFGAVQQLVALTKRAAFSPRAIVTIGRLNVYLRPDEWRQLGALAQRDVADRLHAAAAATAFGGYAEPLLTALWPGAVFDVMDASDYEGANLLHDLNMPLTTERRAQYDLAIEAGTIEHIFNVAEAIRTLMRLVRRDGIVVLDTPSNNLCGHGFFQLSPELVYQVFRETNGFRLDACLLEEFRYPSTELSVRRRVVHPRDPHDVRDRVRVMSDGPVELCAVATRIGDQDPFAAGWPMQSDYQSMWNGGTTDAREARVDLARALWRKLLTRMPDGARRWLRGRREVADARFSNRAKFEPVSPSP